MTGMNNYRLAVIAGDGIGVEVVPAAIRVLDAAADRAQVRLEWEHFPWGSDYYLATGGMIRHGDRFEIGQRPGRAHMYRCRHRCQLWDRGVAFADLSPPFIGSLRGIKRWQNDGR